MNWSFVCIYIDCNILQLQKSYICLMITFGTYIWLDITRITHLIMLEINSFQASLTQ